MKKATYVRDKIVGDSDAEFAFGDITLGKVKVRVCENFEDQLPEGTYEADVRSEGVFVGDKYLLPFVGEDLTKALKTEKVSLEVKNES